MTQIVQLDYNDLQTAIKNCLRESIEEIKKIPSPEPLPDRCMLDAACKITGLSKAQMYKDTMRGTIPHQKYGKRLVFSRQKLQQWIEQRTTDKIPVEESAIKHLQKEANKHLSKC